MKNTLQIGLIGFVVIAVCFSGLAVYSRINAHRMNDMLTANTLAELDKSAAAANARDAAAGSDASQTDPNADSQAQQRYAQRVAFEKAMRGFLRDQAGMNDAQRKAQARTLTAQIDQREQDNELSAGEAIMLRGALIRAVEPDPAKQTQMMADLVQRYNQNAAQREADFARQQNADPRFNAYKTREAQIVAEVQAMRTFPSGMSRDDYLRQRLLEARVAIYSAPQAQTNQPAR